MKRLLCIMYFALPLPGCWEQQEATVQRVNTVLSSELRIRGRFMRESIIQDLERFRSDKHAALRTAQKDALKVVHDLGKLTPEAAVDVGNVFDARHKQLDSMVDAARIVAMAETDWYDNAADVVDATAEFHRTKDRAILTGAAAASESLAQTYIANRRPPQTEEERKAQEQLDTANSELLSLLKARLGVQTGAAQ